MSKNAKEVLSSWIQNIEDDGDKLLVADIKTATNDCASLNKGQTEFLYSIIFCNICLAHPKKDRFTAMEVAKWINSCH